MEYGNYAKEQKNEENVLNEAEDYVKKTMNKRPYIESLNVKEKTENSVVIVAKAADEEEEKIKCKLYFGEDKENLSRQGEERKIAKGIEEIWKITGLKANTKYYYKLEVEDKYVKINSEIKEVITDKVNVAPKLGSITIIKDLDEEKGNWIEIETSGEDEENDTLDYTLKLWKKENEEVEENEVIKGEATKKVDKTNVSSGEKVKLKIEGLEEYTDYVYRVEVSDKKDVTEGEIKKEKTYCSGKTIKCTEAGKACTTCNGTGKCNYRSYALDSAKIRLTNDGILYTNQTCAKCSKYKVHSVYIECKICGNQTSRVRLCANCENRTNYLKYGIDMPAHSGTCRYCHEGKLKCTHGEFYEEHQYCNHIEDDEYHKWHYTKTE